MTTTGLLTCISDGVSNLRVLPTQQLQKLQSSKHADIRTACL